MKDLVLKNQNIKDKIFTLRGVQVMLDRDLAELYGVETKQLNRAVKRNIERFPKEFMFQLTKEESEFLRFQFGTLNNDENNKRGKHSKYLSYVFTEHGVSMLAGILRSERAIKINIQIIKTFISMKNFISQNAGIFQRLDNVEKKQIEYQIKNDKNFDKIFKALEDKSIKPKQGIFFDGQIFDAYKFANDLIKTAKKEIVLIDNYIDENTLLLFSKVKKIKVTIFTKEISNKLKLDLEKYNSQYSPIEIKQFKNSHDRFLIIDNKQIYHFGASLKDLGKKWFAFNKFEIDAVDMLKKLK